MLLTWSLIFLLIHPFFLRASPRTLLTFCTNGVLLRTLMSGNNVVKSITHVIVVRSLTAATELWPEVASKCVCTRLILQKMLFYVFQNQSVTFDKFTNFVRKVTVFKRRQLFNFKKKASTVSCSKFSIAVCIIYL